MKVIKAINRIPGIDGWWCSSTADTFQKVYNKLIEHNFNKEEAILLLEELYLSVSDEYGN